jgi:putative endonuclease
MWHVYILRCHDESLYTGITTDLARRVRAHEEGAGSRYTRTRLPVRLVYSEESSSRAEALRRERQIKGLSRARKLELAGMAP